MKMPRTREQEIAFQVKSLLKHNNSLRQVCTVVGEEFNISWNRVYQIFREVYPDYKPYKTWEDQT